MATLTINTTAAVDTRIIAAYRDKYGPNSTQADVKLWIIEQFKTLVREYERKLKIEAAIAEVTDIQPT